MTTNRRLSDSELLSIDSVLLDLADGTASRAQMHALKYFLVSSENARRFCQERIELENDLISILRGS